MNWKSFLLVALASMAFVTATAVRFVTADEPRKPWTSSRIQGAPYPPAPYKIVSAFPKVRFKKPTCIEEIPHAGRLLVTEIDGKVFSLSKQADVEQADLAIDLAQVSGGQVSLFDADFHPKFAENRQVFLCYVHPGNGGHTRVSRFTMTRAKRPTIAADSASMPSQATCSPRTTVGKHGRWCIGS